MNKILPFFNLIRFKNLAIIILTQCLIKYSLINYFVNDKLHLNSKGYTLWSNIIKENLKIIIGSN